MCGIFGYYNYQVARDRRTILEFLITGLRRLEYRGYDSAGICIDAAHFAPCNGTTTALQSTLPNGELEKQLESLWHACMNAVLLGH